MHCSATDAAGNRGDRLVRVTVLGAAAQLAELQRSVHAARSGASLELKVALARTLLAFGQRQLACLTLTAFAAEVRVRSGRTIPPSTAEALVASAHRIEHVLTC